MKNIALNPIVQMQLNSTLKTRRDVLFFLALALLLLFLVTPTQAKTPDKKMMQGHPVQKEPSAISGAKADTIMIYGGPGTLEGKFQTADMQPDAQGWYSEDLSVPTLTEGDRFQIESFNCANLDPGNPDNHAFWAGDYYEPCAGYPEDQAGGYGNNMDVALGWEGEVADPSSAVTVNVTYILNYDTEIGYDYVHFELYEASTDSWVAMQSYDGLALGWLEDLTFTVQPEDFLDGHSVHVRFHVTSDGAASGADCSWPTDGATQIDNVAISFDQGSGPVPIGPVETFEPDKSTAWNPILPGTPVGDFAQVWASLPEAGTTLNETPRWSFIDDGEVIPELPGYTNGFDYGPGGFCVNAAGGLAGPGSYINNMVRSPAIFLPAGPYQNVIFTYEEYRHQLFQDQGYPIFSWAEVRSTADPAGLTGWTEWYGSGSLYYGGPGTYSVDFPLMGSLVEDCAAIQVSFGIWQVDWWGTPSLLSSPAPYYDNARVKFIPAETVVPEMFPEPTYSRGTDNRVECSDTSQLGSVAYYIECATDPEFITVVANSGWLTDTRFEFTDLVHDQIYYYRAKARDEFGTESDFSEAVFSTQDAIFPESNVTEMDEYQGTSFPVPYAATDEGSGVRWIRLRYNYNGGAYQDLGYFPYSETEPWIDFTAADGEGTYGFYTNARDYAGNYEETPASLPDESVIVQGVVLEPPTFMAEPEFTIGLSNSVAWSDESGSGATVYYADCATDPEFTEVVGTSDWIAGLNFQFAGLTDGQVYYYRVKSGDGTRAESAWSESVFSTQDASPPISSADELPPMHGALTFDIAYTASDATSGVSYVGLMFNVDGGDYTYFDSFTESPMAFTAPGDGVYGFYTIATDSIGNQEAIPDNPPDTETIVDTIASAAPTMVAEPEFTVGVINTVVWSDESASGAMAYYAECATDAEFTSVVAASDWVAELTFEFSGLTDGQIYHYRVMSRDEYSQESAWSAAVFSTQDAAAPISSVDPLPPTQSALAFDVPYTVSDEVSGVAYVELFFNFEGGDYNSFGTFTESPVAFTAASDGAYGFYTIATDAVGNVEAEPDTPPDASTTIDTSASAVPIFAAEPEFTIGLSNTVAWGDESASGAVAYNSQCATDAEFAAVVASSDWITELNFEFAGLTDGQIYYYRVMSRDDSSNESDWSAAVFSTQDAAAPISSADELPPVQSALVFDVAYTATDAVSGVASVELFYSFDGGDYTTFGTFTESPISFTAGAVGAYGFYTMATDMVGNLEGIPETLPDAWAVVEIIGMEGTFFIAGDAASTSTLAVELNSAVTLAVEMRFTNDGAVWPEAWLAYATEFEWLLAEGPDGVRTVYAQYRDDSQAVLELEDDIVFNGTLPSPVAGIQTQRGHNLVNISWTHEEVDAEGYLVYRGMWHQGTPDISAYPYFGLLDDGIVPTRPASHDEVLASEQWQLVSSVEAGVLSFTDTWPDSDSRGIYFYEVFAVNTANNFSLPAAENDRATNYILGDVTGGNGLVNLPDVGIFAGSFGEYITPDNGNPETDFGPTDDNSASGIPIPDGFVDFEDLMILAMSYGYAGSEASDPAVDTAYLSWIRLDQHTYSLRLEQSCSGLKGLNISADLPDGVQAILTIGDLLDQQDGPVFLKNINNHGLDTGMLVLGAGIDISGSGELCRVTLSESGIELDSPFIVVRDVNNNKMDFVMEEITTVPVVTQFALGANYPNPFNPMTTIAFELPEAQSVRLSIYSLDGRLVNNLVQGQFAAGKHSVVWMGRDGRGQTVASGTYFYRIAAGSFQETQKMVLAK